MMTGDGKHDAPTSTRAESGPVEGPGDSEHGRDRKSLSGLLGSLGIRILQVLGAAMLAISVISFLYANWDVVPEPLRFTGLLILVNGIYGAGFLLARRDTLPRLTDTLLWLGVALLPWIPMAANEWLLEGEWGEVGIRLGFLVTLSLASALVVCVRPMRLMPLASALGFLLALWTLSDTALEVAPWVPALVAAAAVLLLVAPRSHLPPRLHSELDLAALAAAVGVASITTWRLEDMITSFATTQPGTSPWTILLAGPGGILPPSLGASFLVTSVAVLLLSLRHGLLLSYIAMVIFGTGLVSLAESLSLPVYWSGAVLVPLGFAAFLLAGYLEKKGMSSLARPCFHGGQGALAVSLLLVIPLYAVPGLFPLGPVILTMAAASCVYAAGGFVMGGAGLIAWSALVFLGALGTGVWGTESAFPVGAFFFALVGWFYLAMGSLACSGEREFARSPLTWIGMATASLSLLLLSGRWAGDFAQTGILVPSLPPDQILAGLWTGLLTSAAYAFLAYWRRSPAFAYPAGIGILWVALCALQSAGIHLRLPALLVPLAVCVAAAVASRKMNGNSLAEVLERFALGMHAVILFLAFLTSPAAAVPALLGSSLVILPVVRHGGLKAVVAVVGGLHGAGYLLASSWSAHPGPPAADYLPGLRAYVGLSFAARYALQLLLLNAIMAGAWLSLPRLRRGSEGAFILGTLAVSVVASLALSLPEPRVAAFIFTSTGLSLLAISHSREAATRALAAGGTLVVLGLCFGLYDLGVRAWSIFTLPPAAGLLVLGWCWRTDRATRDLLYGLGLVFAYLPLSIASLFGIWSPEAVTFLLLATMLLVAGIHGRSRIVAGISLLAVVINVVVQVRGLVWGAPGWLYLGVAGAFLLGLGGLFEFRRATLDAWRRSILENLDAWD